MSSPHQRIQTNSKFIACLNLWTTQPRGYLQMRIRWTVGFHPIMGGYADRSVARLNDDHAGGNGLQRMLA
jgi:hypothetical protein